MSGYVFLLTIILAALFGANADYSMRALKDEVTDLPGKPEGVTFRHFSGYINVGGHKEMFYNFFETSAEDKANAPLLLWTNGGPGCSGLLGLLTEQGPYRPNSEGELELNEYSWTKFANMVFIEQPVGVGFSYTGGDKVDYGDDQAATDNYNFIIGFFERFPEYESSNFFLTSESYGGHYLPTLAKTILMEGGVKNFRGLAVGNPLTYMPYTDYGLLATLAGHQTLPKPLWDSYVKNNCENHMDNPDKTCQTLIDQINELAAGFDPYALDFPVCENESLASGRDERYQMISTMKKASSYKKTKHHVLSLIRGSQSLFDTQSNVDSYFPVDYEPCSENYASKYLNDPAVMKALHVNLDILGADFEWKSCADIDYSLEDTLAPMMPVWEFLTSGGFKLKLMIYSGDDDTVCSTAATQKFMWDMNWDIQEDWAPWKVLDGQTGGFRVKFSNPRQGGGELQFATVHGAGHMVPSTRPAQSFHLIKNFILGGDEN